MREVEQLLAAGCVWLAGHEPSRRFYANAECTRALAAYRRAQKSLATVAKLLSGKPADQLLPEGDGLTVGRLQELVTLQRQLVA